MMKMFEWAINEGPMWAGVTAILLLCLFAVVAFVLTMAAVIYGYWIVIALWFVVPIWMISDEYRKRGDHD